jgi:hypothetical protein
MFRTFTDIPLKVALATGAERELPLGHRTSKNAARGLRAIPPSAASSQAQASIPPALEPRPPPYEEAMSQH